MEELIKVTLVGGRKLYLSTIKNIKSLFDPGDRVEFSNGDEGTVVGYGDIPFPSFATQHKCIPSNGQFTLCFGRCTAVFIALDKNKGKVSYFCRYDPPQIKEKKEDVKGGI